MHDIQYRMRQQWNPLRSWALIDGELWTLYVSSSPVRANFSQAQGGLGQSKTRKEGSMSNAHNFCAFNQKKGRDGTSLGMSPIEFRKAVSGKLCFDFNSTGCSRQKCKFMHKCVSCKYPSPVKVEKLIPLLQLYPKRAAAQKLKDDFTMSDRYVSHLYISW